MYYIWNNANACYFCGASKFDKPIWHRDINKARFYSKSFAQNLSNDINRTYGLTTVIKPYVK